MPQTMAKLRTMFAGYSTMDPQPVAFVFFGDFTMEPPGPRQATVLKGVFCCLLHREQTAMASCPAQSEPLFLKRHLKQMLWTSCLS